MQIRPLLAIALLACGLAPLPARALEALDGDLQLHGYAETQMRTLARNYHLDDGYHLAQWWNILSFELEWDIAPDGWGPFDSVSAYSGIEARYDCVWTGGCYTFPGYENRYGDDASKLPRHLSNGRRSGMAGEIDLGPFADRRNNITTPFDAFEAFYGAPAGLDVGNFRKRSLARLWNTPLIGTLLFTNPGIDRIWGSEDDPGFYVGEALRDYRFAVRKSHAPTGGIGTEVLGPWRPQDKLFDPGIFRDRANPLREGEINPVLKKSNGDPAEGDGALPFRPAPLFGYDEENVPEDQAQGLFYPDPGYRRMLDSTRFEHHPDMNFSQTELSLNHGASQERWRELKELYVDLEMFDHQLWLRLGRQTIVWGKTELFRAQDRFNPQDIGIASLPSLEESRIPVWSARGIWSFYDVGPLQDVRLELAANIDEFEPIDIGRCGEPFAPRPQCMRSFGFLAYSMIGAGLAGELRPPPAWESLHGVEGGARLEFRTDSVSYALTYFNGFEDIPYAKPIFRYDRNVDPLTGRPRFAETNLPCDPDGLHGPADDSGCIGTPGGTYGETLFDQQDVLLRHYANQTLFSTVCASTIGFVTYIEPLSGTCGFGAFNSIEPLYPPDSPFSDFSPTAAMAFSVALSGQPTNPLPAETDPPVEPLLFNSHLIVAGIVGARALDMVGLTDFSQIDDIPLVPLSFDPNDRYADDEDWYCARATARGRPELCTDVVDLPPPTVISLEWRKAGVSRFLTDEQEALLGCGRFFGTDCEADGWDIFNAEASAIFQSWPGFPGTASTAPWDTFDTSIAQPGTAGFFSDADGNPTGGALCTRYVDGNLVTLPGCRGPGDPGYDILVDGAPTYYDKNNPAVLPNLAPDDPRLDDPTLYSEPFDLFPGHPFTGQEWDNEMAIVSWNLMVLLVTTSTPREEDDDGDLDDDGIVDDPVLAGDGLHDEFQPQYDPLLTPDEDAHRRGQGGRFDEFNPVNATSPDRCSYRNPVVCKTVGPFLQLAAPNKKSVLAAGNGRFGRSTFVWHDGAQMVIDYPRNHVLGFAMDFAEDVTKTSWGIEGVWLMNQRFMDNGSEDVNTTSDVFSLTVSVDRPTFVNFLNRNRTLFFNAQLFLQYIPDHSESFLADGPLNATMTFAVFTGYFQDRLVPGLIFVLDPASRSGGLLYSLGYRISPNLSLTIGANAFFGRTQEREAALVPLGAGGNGGGGKGAQKAFVENGLSVLRDRDEIFFRARYTF